MPELAAQQIAKLMLSVSITYLSNVGGVIWDSSNVGGVGGRRPGIDMWGGREEMVGLIGNL